MWEGGGVQASLTKAVWAGKRVGMRVVLSKAARKALLKLEAGVADRIVAKIETYASDPAAQAPNLRRLKGRDGYRLRVGDYRVIFTIWDGAVEIMYVERIGHRKDVYDD